MPVKSTKQENYLLGFLIFLGVSALGLSFLQFRYNLRTPFAYNPSDNQNLSSNIDPEIAATLDLQAKDTDNDGLSDYDELNLYNTSPYLDDSDSDGFSDKQEIESSNDPNCPKGKTCASISNTEQNTSAQATQNLLDLSRANSSVTPGVENIDISQLEIRKLLLDSGTSAAILNQYSDKELQQLFQESLTEQGLGTTTFLEPAKDNSVNNLSADEIRQLFKSIGIPEQDYISLDDNALLQLFNEILAQ